MSSIVEILNRLEGLPVKAVLAVPKENTIYIDLDEMVTREVIEKVLGRIEAKEVYVIADESLHPFDEYPSIIIKVIL